MMQGDEADYALPCDITPPTLWPLLPLFGRDRSIGLFWCGED